ncbi:MAG: hypothetical protein PHO30_00810 [Candidatus Omnitrophica bacterium]|nr:hypothetical protein [Candidatus Omnitrophota bacterium]
MHNGITLALIAVLAVPDTVAGIFPEASGSGCRMLSPRLTLNQGAFQDIFRSRDNRTNAGASLDARIRDAEMVLYRFAMRPDHYENWGPRVLYSARTLLHLLYQNESLAQTYIPLSQNREADRKLKIIHIALLLNLCDATGYARKNIINDIINKIMNEALIRRSYKIDTASANFHYYINSRNKRWYYRLWVTIAHELGHNIQDRTVGKVYLPGKYRQVDAVCEFFADLCSYIVVFQNGWTYLFAVLFQTSKQEYNKVQRRNNGVVIYSHRASQSQWNRLLRGINIFPLRGTAKKFIAMFHRALSIPYPADASFRDWIYTIGGVEQNFPLPGRAGDDKVIELADISLDNVGYVREPAVKSFSREGSALIPQQRVLLDAVSGLRHAPDYITGQAVISSAGFINQSL